VDTYRTGLVSARSLMEYLTNLVDLPKLDKWKLEELSRLLDPNKDNRYVDMGLWSEVGKSWVEMMMDPDNHSKSYSGDDENLGGGLEDEHNGCENNHIKNTSLSNISFGSIEGIAGETPSNSSSREVELENKISELRYQVSKLQIEKRELERNLAASEDLGVSLTSELVGSQRQMMNLSSSVCKSEMLEAQQVREAEEKSCSLSKKVDELTRDLNLITRDRNEKEDKMSDMEVLIVSLKGN